MIDHPLGVEQRGPDPRRLAPRFVAFGIAIILAVTGLGLRLFQLQVAQGAYYETLADQQLTATRPIPVARGLVFDRKGRQLVENVPTFVMRILPAELPFADRPDVAERISRLTDIPARKIIERLDAHTGSQYELVRITDIETETARIIAMLGAEIMFCPTAAPGYAHGVHWTNLNIMRAVDNGMFAVYSNRVGQEGNNNYFGESMIVNPMGEVIAKAEKEENHILMAECDLSLVDKARISVPTLRDMRGDFWMKYYAPTYDRLI
jgi:cell division protein FtsI/penicillin-binding protein 2